MVALASLDVDKLLAGHTLALTDAGLEQLRAHVLARLTLFDEAPREFVSQAVAAINERAQPHAGRPRSGATGVIPIKGTISQHAQGDLSSLLAGGTSVDEITAALRAMVDDPEISKIVLRIDSPGGSTFGITELAAEIRAARAQKPVIAIADPMAASAAYWLGAQADQFYSIPSGLVGSIGIFTLHQDVSAAAEKAGVKTTVISAGKFKADGLPFEALNDDARARVQVRVDEAYSQFVSDVAKGRGVPESTVRSGYGEGDVATAKQAKALGMIDGIYTFEQAVAKAATVRPAASAGLSGQTLWGLPVIEDDAEEVRPEPTPEPPTDEEGQERLARMRLRSFQARAAAGAA